MIDPVAVLQSILTDGLFQDPAEHIDTETEIDGPGGSGCREGGMCYIEPGPDGKFGKTFQSLDIIHYPVELEVGRDPCLIAESGDLIRFLVRIARVRRKCTRVILRYCRPSYAPPHSTGIRPEQWPACNVRQGPEGRLYKG